jgi:hypothetical protein
MNRDRDWLRFFEIGGILLFVIAALFWVAAQSLSAPSQPASHIDTRIQVYAHAMPNQGWAPLTVYFSPFGTHDPNGKILRYQWDMDGNGSFETDATRNEGYASYVYTKPGDLTITLKVTNDRGDTNTAATSLQVRHPASSSVDYWNVFDKDRVRRVEVRLTQADWALMWADPPSKTQVPANAIIFGERLDQVGFRMRGQFSLRESRLKKPWKIDTDAYVSGQEFHNLRQLVFTNNIGDPSMLQEMLAYEMMQFAGVPASHVCYVEFWVDLVDDDQPPMYWGVYTLIERVDKNFLSNRFGSEAKGGNLYKASHAQRGPMDLVYYGPSIEDYPTQDGLYAYGKATNEAAADYSDIIHLMYVIDGVRYDSPEAFAQALEQVLNVDSFLRYMAVVDLLSNWDSYPNTGNNFYLFNNSVSGVFEWIPWDLTWGEDPRLPLFEWDGPKLVKEAPLYTHVFEVTRFRVTVDNGLTFYHLNKFSNHFLNKQVNYQDTVVELKYHKEDDPHADQIAAGFPFRVTRSSKYVQGIDKVYL